ncbi:daunorubicin resistance protein DrrA family ABC transporter ATP-binding protein [Saccharomonospora viridis]|uniref:ABC transporter n=1 Tax=Saccharomonospora viridis TaxID=1852 RepID=A0A837D9U0_9PSEU|nr:ABC transporter [Saccharomonospora viridis]SFP23955.1 ABC-2 type transport system ATP-binding protein [Saccharomonospora viridis]
MPAMDEQVAVRARGLVKSYGSTQALNGVDLDVLSGRVLGLLGPNGAGKTTVVRILTTLLRPDAGEASVAGHDVLTEPDAVRAAIGVSGQYAAVDENLTGFENLYMIGRLYGLSKRHAKQRSRELLKRFQLAEAADRTARGYSGGMRRRLDLAGALVAEPKVVVLDEPTTGLDPRGRLEMWQVIEQLVATGATVLLTTQYLEEADRLADSIVVIDKGVVIARGTAEELKQRIGGERLELVLENAADVPRAVRILEEVGTSEPVVEEPIRTVTVSVDAGAKALVQALRKLDAQHLALQDVALRRPTLDDVFLALTGRATATDEETTS